MHQKLIWVALVGIAAAFASRSLLQNKSSVASSTAGAAANLKIPAGADSVPSLPPAGVVEAVEPPVAKTEPAPSPVEDPEKIAILISALSEAEVCKWLGTLANHDLTGNTGRLLLRRWVELDPVQSQQLALSLPSGPLRDQALSTVATVQARQDGAGAARFAVQNLSPGTGLDSAVIGVIQMWAQNDLASTAFWIQSFPAPPIRDQAVQSLNMIRLH